MSLRKLKRKQGWIWHLDIRLPGPDGRRTERIIKSLKTTDREVAEKRYHALAQELYAGNLDTQSAAVTLKDLQERVLGFYANSARGTYSGFKYALQSLQEVFPADTPLVDIRRAQIDQWRIEAQKALKVASVNHYAGKLGRAFALAVEWEILDKNPFSRIGRLDDPTRGDKRLYFADDEIETILEALDAHTQHPFLASMARICLYCGLRLGEMIHLRSEHIQGEHLRIEMRTKGRKFRILPLFDETRAVLKKQLAEEKNGILFFCPRTEHGYFPGASINRWFQEVINPKGIAGHWHMLRHTFAARLLSDGVPILTVSRWLGHSSVTITEERYGHLVPGSQDHLIEKVFREGKKDDTKPKK